MNKVVVKKKVGLRTSGFSGGSSVQTSNLRPQHVKKTPPCQNNCPNFTSVREILMTIQQSEKFGRTLDQSFESAWYQFAEKNPFPGVIGRVCPHPCETGCNRQYKDESVAINNLERFIGDFGLKHNLQFKKLNEGTYGEKIAIIGSGPAGMSCAYQLARLGYKVTVFEAFPKPGGMLRYGIPAYRLPREVLDSEYKKVTDFGVELKCNIVIGKDIPLEQLRKEFDVIFVGIGAHKGRKLGIPGEELGTIWTGTDFLHKANEGENVNVGSHVVVVGGGDTAIDAARVSRRLGAKATILYRRTRDEMPAIDEEIKGAEEEGVEFHYLAIPVEAKSNGGGKLMLKCQRMELGEPDDSGRRRPIPKEGDYFDLEVSTLIAAISQEPNFTGLDEVGNAREWIKVDDEGKTKVEKVFAGGDNNKLGLVVDALFHGRRAAQTIHAQLRGLPPVRDVHLNIIQHDKMLLSFYDPKPRNPKAEMPPEERLASFDKEITFTYTSEEAANEAGRCLSCGNCFDCGQCWSFCQDGAIIKPLIPGEPYKFKMEFCNGCKKCAEQCPCGYIEMH